MNDVSMTLCHHFQFVKFLIPWVHYIGSCVRKFICPIFGAIYLADLLVGFFGLIYLSDFFGRVHVRSICPICRLLSSLSVLGAGSL